jgi:50S ribosomal protein L16 3-hydroxylase
MTTGEQASAVSAATDPTIADSLLPLLLRNEDAPRFWSSHYLRQPFGSVDGAAPLRGLLTDERLETLIASACDVTVVRDGRLGDDPRPTTAAAAWERVASGSSLVFRHVERHDPVIAGISGALMLDVLGPVDAHIYVTPAGHHGFGWHYDAEEVFFLHLDGVKDFFLRRNTVNPDPVPEAMPRDLRFEEETSPIMQCRVHPGDWLYIPRGWWHMARARVDSRSLSLGLLAPTPLAVIGSRRGARAEDPRWCQRLPPTGRAVPDARPPLEAWYHALSAVAPPAGLPVIMPRLMGWLERHRSEALRLLCRWNSTGREAGLAP